MSRDLESCFTFGGAEGAIEVWCDNGGVRIRCAHGTINLNHDDFDRVAAEVAAYRRAAAVIEEAA